MTCLKRSTTTQRERVAQGWKLHDLIQRSVDKSNDALRIYRDDSKLRQEEISRMSNEEAVDDFYDKLREIKQYHRVNARRHDVSNNDVEEMLTRQFNEDDSSLETKFSGEESYGSCLDLHALYSRFLNLRRTAKKTKEEEEEDDTSSNHDLNYRAYLDIFHRTNAVLVERKEPLVVEDKSFLDYLSDLVSYFESFLRRSEPLMIEEMKTEMKKWENEFENLDPFESYKSIPGYLDMNTFETEKDLEKLGPDVLKAALLALGLKCGGRSHNVHNDCLL